MKKIIINNWWWALSIISILLLISHCFSFAIINVDTTTLILLAILIVSPYVNNITKIKIGDFEAEISSDEIDKIKCDVEKEVKHSEFNNICSNIHNDDLFASIYSLYEKDYVLALAKLNIEIEKKLRFLYKIRFLADDKISISKIILNLYKESIITKDTSKALNKIISIFNRAIHGRNVDSSDVLTMIEVGIDVINIISTIIETEISTPTCSKAIDEKELRLYMDMQYEVQTVIPYVEKPLLCSRVLSQDQLDQLLEGYSEYAEFFVKITPIIQEDKLLV